MSAASERELEDLPWPDFLGHFAKTEQKKLSKIDILVKNRGNTFRDKMAIVWRKRLMPDFVIQGSLTPDLWDYIQSLPRPSLDDCSWKKYRAITESEHGDKAKTFNAYIQKKSKGHGETPREKYKYLWKQRIIDEAFLESCVPADIRDDVRSSKRVAIEMLEWDMYVKEARKKFPSPQDRAELKTFLTEVEAFSRKLDITAIDKLKMAWQNRVVDDDIMDKYVTPSVMDFLREKATVRVTDPKYAEEIQEDKFRMFLAGQRRSEFEEAERRKRREEQEMKDRLDRQLASQAIENEKQARQSMLNEEARKRAQQEQHKRDAEYLKRKRDYEEYLRQKRIQNGESAFATQKSLNTSISIPKKSRLPQP